MGAIIPSELIERKSHRSPCLASNVYMDFIESVQTIETYPSGAIIIQEGDEANCFYMLEKGAIEIYIDNTLLNVVIYPESIIGEVAFSSGKTRTASIRARSETTLRKYECKDIQALIAEHPDVAVRIIETLASRRTRTTEKLSELAKHLN